MGQLFVLAFLWVDRCTLSDELWFVEGLDTIKTLLKISLLVLVDRVTKPIGEQNKTSLQYKMGKSVSHDWKSCNWSPRTTEVELPDSPTQQSLQGSKSTNSRAKAIQTKSKSVSRKK